jgi:hypothetical protein
MAASSEPPVRRPSGAPRRTYTQADFEATPFQRLALVHALSTAGDTLVAVALAGSLFFSIDPGAARERVALYLLLTVAPFAVVAPLIGPAIDRMAGGRRLMIVAAAALRALACLLMVRTLDSLWLFPIAFSALVLGKSYQVSRSALVPSTVQRDDELVEANAKLGLISGLVGFVAAVPGLVLSALGGPEWTVGLGIFVFVVATGAALRLPRTTVAAEPAGAEEQAELRSGGIVLAVSAMALLRAIVGFLTFLVAFWFRKTGAETVWFGLAVAASGIGALGGSAIAPAVRRSLREETMLVTVLVTAAVAGVTAAGIGGRGAALVLAFGVGLAAASGKLAFDAIVQRDAPEANRGRSFARFETRFQLAWVGAAFVPVVVPIADTVGYLVISGISAFAAITYVVGLRTLRERGEVPTPLRRRAVRTLRSRGVRVPDAGAVLAPVRRRRRRPVVPGPNDAPSAPTPPGPEQARLPPPGPPPSPSTPRPPRPLPAPRPGTRRASHDPGGAAAPGDQPPLPGEWHQR